MVFGLLRAVTAVEGRMDMLVNSCWKHAQPTCYTHDGVAEYCSKPKKNTCYTTGGVCPENAHPESQGVTHFCQMEPLTWQPLKYLKTSS
mmetsp:Transcript_21690/g.50316  ORF Transcript_21690/g.50316 Transcript_21690/m.50316 type:complete len:89 (+) Transcript_21690:103-369(+)